MGNFRDYVARILPRAFSGELSAGWFGVLHGYTGDLLAQGMTNAMRMPWLLDKNSPDDVLPLIGSERGLIKYTGEPNYRARLLDAWNAYTFAGTELELEAQLALWGHAGKITFYPGRDGPNGHLAPYWSQFWIRFPTGTHPVTYEGPPWDSFTWDFGFFWGPLGYTPEFSAALHGIVSKWKPVEWICRGFIFENGTAVWNGFNWDDGTVWSGAIEIDF